MQNKKEISVVIPVYGCKGALTELYERLTKTLQDITENYEIIMVEDHCPQNSWEIIESICEGDERVIGLQLSRNFGQMKAILAGLDVSQGEWVVVMDCDLQDAPEEIINLYNKAREGFDIVFSRRKERHDNKLKILISTLFYRIYSWLSDDCYDPAMNNFCICKRIVVDNFCSMREWHRAFTMYLKWLGFKTAVIDVEHHNRKEGKSSYSMRTRMKLAIDILVSQSDKVLKFIVKVGFVMSLLSLIAAVVVFVRYFFYDIAAGWTSTIIVLFLIGGLILTAIGCVGIYVGNIFMQCKQRPLYIIREKRNIR